ncbi:conserved hypothetical protein [Talaromyces stipitatus ATCC 10500]|uniref:Uncharacterized protein n=1 Tax=Talaromyces stipitatus (strain ATCC 10500 / CBS 375.48 / QM 6759 / NRRL 1006) TaxID=441959 RepID=B8MKD1_TALSN|nr:uncharacterized protein TSTA_047350 [Talaromyces stipitatus ATCC 10500]EED15286.1 conserved hypothetical protein [Talaromyces stipitatus ATCC 10500]
MTYLPFQLSGYLSIESKTPFTSRDRHHPSLSQPKPQYLKMILKNFLLLTSLAYLGHSTPLSNASPEPNEEASSSLEARSSGVWLDIFHSGSCDGGAESQPTSGWVWAGQCKNIEPNSYGAKLGYNVNEWPYWCILKFWEGENCHGHATTTKIGDTEKKEHVTKDFEGNYNCIATANKGGQFYLGGGASSVMLIC